MIPINVNNLEKTDRIFLGWSSWNNYLDDVRKQLKHAGFKYVDIHEIKKHWSTVLFLPFILIKMFYYLFYYDAFFLFDGKSFFLPIPLKISSKLSFLCFKDLWLLKFLNKKIYFVFQGEIRDYNLEKYKNIAPCDRVKSTVKVLNSLKKKYLRKSDGIIISTVDLFEDLPKHCIEKTVWIPKLINCDIRPWCYKISSLDARFKANRIIHAITSRGLKGTDLLEAAFKKIDKFKFLVFEHKTRSYIYQEAQDCFCAIDQLFLGIYGTFCIEMMSFDIPVLGYISPEARGRFKEKYGADVPILQIEPEDLLATIQKQIKFLSNFENYCLQIKRQKNFLEKFHKLNKEDI